MLRDPLKTSRPLKTKFSALPGKISFGAIGPECHKPEVFGTRQHLHSPVSTARPRNLPCHYEEIIAFDGHILVQIRKEYVGNHICDYLGFETIGTSTAGCGDHPSHEMPKEPSKNTPRS